MADPHFSARRRVPGALAAGQFAADTPARQRSQRVDDLSLRRGPNAFEDTFPRGPRERGLVPGRQPQIHFHWADGDFARRQAMAAQVVE